MSQPVLYHVPPSFYSQIVRLALSEKAIAYESRYVIPGPPAFETYEPWYMRLNPGGTVPTLMHDGNVIDDSRDILEYLDEHFPATDLLNRSSERQGEIIDEWISKIYSVPFRELSYGSPRIKRLGAFINKKRVRNLRMRREETPELAMEYGAKIMDIEGFSRNARSPVCLKRTQTQIELMLFQLDDALKTQKHIAGGEYSMADLVWTVGIARMLMLGITPFTGRPHLKRWYAQMKSRPSFAEAMVMERLKPTAILRVLWSKLKTKFSRPPKHRHYRVESAVNN